MCKSGKYLHIGKLTTNQYSQTVGFAILYKQWEKITKYYNIIGFSIISLSLNL